MKPLVIGTREYVAGFALAGVEGVVCKTGEEAADAITRAGEDALLILSAGLVRRTPPAQFLVVLPARS